MYCLQLPTLSSNYGIRGNLVYIVSLARCLLAPSILSYTVTDIGFFTPEKLLNTLYSYVHLHLQIWHFYSLFHKSQKHMKTFRSSLSHEGDAFYLDDIQYMYVHINTDTYHINQNFLRKNWQQWQDIDINVCIYLFCIHKHAF